MTDSQAEEAPIEPTPSPAKGKTGNALAVVALILAICSVLFGCPFLHYAWLLSLPAFLLGLLALFRPNRKVTATIAIVLTIFGICLRFWLLPSIAEIDYSAVCASNCSAIGRAMKLYSDDNGGAVPPSLDPLVDKNLIPHLSCPGRTAWKGRTSSGWDYFYFPPAPDAPGDALVLCDKKNNHYKNIRNVLIIDGNVRMMQDAQFQEELKTPCNAAFAKALREAEGP